MKEINKASYVLLLIDEYDKSPITKANISCNDKKVNYIKKDDGHYIFLNMLEGDYKLEISCKGYNDVIKEIKVTDVQPEQEMILMQHCLGDTSMFLKDKIIFDVLQNEQLAKNADVTLCLDTKISYLKLIEPGPRGSNLIEINYDFNKNLLFQEYVYDKQPNLKMTFIGYDWDKNKYILKESPAEKIVPGGNLKPIWRFKTNKNGRFLSPINSFFIHQKEADFTIILDGQEVKTTVKIDTEVLQDVNFKVEKKEVTKSKPKSSKQTVKKETKNKEEKPVKAKTSKTKSGKESK